jgi:hypothetical protein
LQRSEKVVGDKIDKVDRTKIISINNLSIENQAIKKN